MPAEVIDANETTQAAPPVFDQNAFANQIVQGLAQSLQSQKSQERAVDEIDQVVGTLKAAGLDDATIQAHISTALGLDKRLTRVVDERAKDASSKLVNFIQNKEVTSTVNRVLRSYTKDDELLKEAADTIRQRTIQELFNGNTGEVVTARNAFFQTGSLDEDAVETIMLKHIKRIENAADKRSGKSKQTSPTLPNSDTSARPSGNVDPQNFDAASLSPLQETVYNANKSQMLKSGMKPEDAEASARAAALRIKK